MDEGTLEQINSHINLPITMVYLKTVFPYGFYLNLNQGFSWQT
jgi:hypothetical protein